MRAPLMHRCNLRSDQLTLGKVAKPLYILFLAMHLQWNYLAYLLHQTEFDCNLLLLCIVYSLDHHAPFLGYSLAWVTTRRCVGDTRARGPRSLHPGWPGLGFHPPLQVSTYCTLYKGWCATVCWPTVCSYGTV